MSEIIAGLIVLAALALTAWSQYQVIGQMREFQKAEDKRTRDWWQRSQSHIDNLQDRVMSKEFETYAQASYVEKPADQPIMNAEGEYNAGGMAQDVLEILRRQQTAVPYADDVPDIAEDYAGPIVG